jgi:hypothetical protein
MDIAELVRVLRSGAGDRASMQLLHYNRRTIAKYRRWAQAQGLLDVTRPLPPVAELHRLVEATLPRRLPPQQTSSLALYAEEIADYRARGMEMAAIRVRLEERHRRPVSYSAVHRLVERLEQVGVGAGQDGAGARAAHDVVVRVEVAPGSEAQVDFGYAGLTLDPTTGAARKTWVFVLVLSWSRHLYAELVFDQRVECEVRKPSHSGGGQFVLVNQAIESVTAIHRAATVATVGLVGRWANWRQQPECTVWPGPVVMACVVAQYLMQVPPPDDEPPVETRAAHRAHPPFREGVGRRRPGRTSYHPRAFGGEHRVEGGRELRVAIPEQHGRVDTHFGRVPGHIARLLGDPRRRRMRGVAGREHATRVDLEEEQDVQRLQAHRLDGEKVARQ